MADKLPIYAHYIGNSLNLAQIEQSSPVLALFPLKRKERNLLVFSSGDNQYLCVYAFGVVTVCGVEDRARIGELLKLLAYGEDLEEGKDPKTPPEDYNIAILPDQPESVEFDHVRLKQLTLEKFLLLSHVMAQSVAIDFVERRIADTQRALESIHSSLAKHGQLKGTTTQGILKTVGMSRNMVHFMVSRLSLLDKPDITWEDKDAEILFMKLREMFELDDRFEALRFKLDFIKDSSETLINVMSAKKAHVLEMIIIVLILIEIVMGLMPFFGIK